MRGKATAALIGVAMIMGGGRYAAATELPAELRAAYVQTVQRRAGASYDLVEADGSLAAIHPKQSWRADFDGRRVLLSDSTGAPAATFELVAVNGRAVAAPKVTAEGNEVVYHRPGVDEWYVHGPLGLEQGFTVRKRHAAEERLRLQLAWSAASGAEVREVADGLHLELASGRRIRVTDLHAYDAAGRTLPSRLRVDGDRLTITTDVRGAAWPVVVDPLYSEEQRLLAGDGDDGDEFGTSVAVDGDTAVVGAPNSDGSGNTNAGLAYVFVRSAGVWTEEQQLEAGDAADFDFFGHAVDISGDSIVVGAPSDDTASGAEAGSAYVFTRTLGVWTQQQKLEASDAEAGDQFGFDVAIDGDTVVAGAPTDDTVAGEDAGSAYAFTRTLGVWSQQQKLEADAVDAGAGDGLGASVDIDNATVVAGAPRDETSAGAGAGSAYVFFRVGPVWSQQQKLEAGDAAANDDFGMDVGIDLDSVVVGAPLDDVTAGVDAGSAYVFFRTGASWSQQQKLEAADGAADDQFGTSVAIDVDTVAVGSPFDDTVSAVDQGSAYVFTRSGSTWTQQQKIEASVVVSGESLGGTIAVSTDTIIAGAPLTDTFPEGGFRAGLIEVFTRSLGTWSSQQRISPSEGADQFGESVAVDGDTAVVGAPTADASSVANAGAAYVFVRSGAQWALQQKLVASDAATNDRFGQSVDVDGDTVIVGAYIDSTAAGQFTGSAYVFVRSGTTWTEEQQLIASDADFADLFGVSVAVDGDSAVVGANFDDTNAGGMDIGSAYVFVRSGSTWTEEQILEPSSTTGAFGVQFGTAVDIEGDTAVVTALAATNSGGAFAGDAYVFTRSGTTWTEEQRLQASDAAAGGQFGRDAALSGETVIVGSRADTSAGADAGAAYVFTRSAGTWTEQQKLEAGDAAEFDEFGFSVALDGDTAVIGARFVNLPDAVNTGAAYVFSRTGSTWTQQQKLEPSTPTARASAGRAVALDGSTLLVGAPFATTISGSIGAAYAFALPAPPDQVVVETGATGGASPEPAPDFGQGAAVSGSGTSVAFIGGADPQREGVYRDTGGTVTVIADAGTSVPGSTDTFDTEFIDVDVEGVTVAFTSNLGAYGTDGGPLFVVANQTTAIPSGGGATFDTFGKVEVTNGDIVFQGGTGGVVTGIYRDRNRVLTRIADTTTVLPGARTPTAFAELASNAGDIAFSVESATGPAVYRESASVFTLIADDTTSVPPGLTNTFDDFDGVSILAGDVAFVGRSPSLVGIYQDTSGTLEEIVDSGDTIPTSPTETFGDFVLAGHLANGQVAFVGLDGSANTEGIFRASTTLAPTTMFDASGLLPNGTGPLDSIGETATNGDTVIFVAFDALSSYLGTFEVGIGSAATQKALGAVPGGTVFISLGRPVLAGSLVVFSARTTAFTALYTLNLGGTLQRLVDTSVPLPAFPEFDRFPDYDVAGGEVTFVAEDTDGLFSVHQGATASTLSTLLAPTAALPGNQTLGATADPGLRSDGALAVVADQAAGIFVADGTTISAVADATTADPDGGGTLGADFGRANLAGVVYAFIAEDSGGNPGVYRRSGGTVSLVANDTSNDPERPGTLAGFGPSTEVSVSGTSIVFNAADANGNDAIYFSSGGALQTLVQAQDAISGSSATVDAIDGALFDYENGKLVFVGTDDASRRAVFLVSGGEVSVLVDSTDTVPGTSRSFSDFLGVSLSGNTVALTGQDTAGTLDVYTVDLEPPPAPAVPLPAWALAAMALAFLLFVPRRPHHSQ